MMTKSELAQLIDAYAASKASGNKYLVEKMIEELNAALTEVCDSRGEISQPQYDFPSTPAELAEVGDEY